MAGFGFRMEGSAVCKIQRHSYAKNQMTLGIGGGQTSRVFSAEIAVLKAQQMNLV